jgi:type IV secretory pathway VirB10-like protein
MEKNEAHINVLPQLNSGGRKFKSQPVDPDVENILKSQEKDIDIFGTSQPTKEEQIKEGDCNSSYDQWPWLIMILAFIVVILIIVIVWYVLRENECETLPPKIPQNIIQPGQPIQMNPNQFHQMRGMPIHPMQNTEHPMHPHNRPQSEQLQTQAHQPQQQQPSKQPTKTELLSTLNQMKLDPIKEEPEKKLKQREPKIVQINTDQEQKQEQEHVGDDDDDEQDEKLASKFYTNLQKNIDDEEEDDEIKGENSAD